MRRDFFRWRRDERGAVVVFAGVGIAAAVGIAAFAVDLSNAYSTKGRLQNAADAAALAAAQMLSLSGDEEEAEARALAIRFTELNVNRADGAVSGQSDVEFGQYHAATRTFRAGVEPYNAVRVTTQRTAGAGNPVQTYFGGLFGVSTIDITAVAIAMKTMPGTCLYALDDSGSEALALGGVARLSSPNCAIQVNSASSTAAATWGNGSVDSASTCIVGDYSGRGFTPKPETGCPRLDDPLAGVPEPEPPGPCYMTDFEIKTSQVLPSNRTYCGSATFAGNSHITLEPGIYYFKDAEVNISSASFTGEDVLIFLDGNSTLHVSGNGRHDISAAETGPHAGIALFHSRSANNPTNTKSGNSILTLHGAVYMPSSTFEVSGTGGVNAQPGKVRSGQGQGQGQGQGEGEGEGEGEGQAEGEGGSQPVRLDYVEYVIAHRFHLTGNANVRVGRTDEHVTAGRSILVY